MSASPRSRISTGLYIIWILAFAWVLIWSYIVWGGERPQKSRNDEIIEKALQKFDELIQKIDKSTQSQPSEKYITTEEYIDIVNY